MALAKELIKVVAAIPAENSVENRAITVIKFFEKFWTIF
jgi:hypothetical protein